MCWRHGIKLVKHYGPDVYMNLVKYADLFITSSFHGTAFATIYKKTFWYIRSKDSESSKDDRAITFLSQLGLMSRYKTVDELKQLDLYEKTNFIYYYGRLSALIYDSMFFRQEKYEISIRTNNSRYFYIN